jgi:hypothetical protein
MSTRIEKAGTAGDSSRHLTAEELERAFKALPSPAADSGRVALIVSRPATDVREVLKRARLTPEEGLAGDRWQQRPDRMADAQLAVMRRDVAELVANGQPIALAGDNLFVDLDLSVANLPTGSRLSVGEAVVEVTPMPHNGCSKLRARFGADAFRLVNAPSTRHLNLRGVYWRVIEAGEVWEGAPVTVLSRGAAGM